MELGGGPIVETDCEHMDVDQRRMRPSTRYSRWIARTRPVIWLIPIIVLAFISAYAIRFDGEPSSSELARLATFLPLIVVAKTVAFLLMRLTLSCHAFVSLHDAFRLLKSTFVASATVAAVDVFFVPEYNIPRGVIVIDGCLTALMVGGVLSLRRAFRERRELRKQTDDSIRVLVVAGPASSELLIRAIRQNRTQKFSLAGILTDAERLQHREIGGIPVLGCLQQVEEMASKSNIEMLLLSSGDLPGVEVRRIVAVAEALDIEVRILPDVSKIVSGQIDFRPREVAIEDLLGRPTVDIDQSELKHWLAGKRLLVTGSCGSIGSELVRQLLAFDPAHITLVDRSENGQFHLGRELQNAIARGKADIVLADVADIARVNTVFRQFEPQIVFHAAAYKHVPLMEHNPGEGIKNIVGATKVLADIAHASGVETFVMISTDKAVNPTSVMGCCKRVAELYVQNIAKRSTCRFVTVRFGNVLGSAGSVIPIFREQIANGGPVTITHPDMTRYFMTIPEASQLVIQAAAMGKGGEIFVLDMGSPVHIVDLAKDMIQLSGLRLGHDIDIEFSGLRPGEKLYEELYAENETRQKTTHQKILVAESIKCNTKTIQDGIQTLLSLATSDRDSICRQLHEIVPSYTCDVLAEPVISIAETRAA